MIKTVIFDWAGTTVDYGCMAPVQSFIRGFRTAGIDVTNSEARGPMGLAKYDHTAQIARLPRIQDQFRLKNGREPTDEDIRCIYEAVEAELLRCVADYVDIKPFVIDTVNELKRRGIQIGSTTGYTRKMMDRIIPIAEQSGFRPDSIVASDEVKRGRPAPFMIWRNLLAFGVEDPKTVLKIGDTAADILEGKNAGAWTVAVINGSSEMGLSKAAEDVLPDELLRQYQSQCRAKFYEAGADYIINDLSELPAVLEDINEKSRRWRENKLLTPGPLSTRHSVKTAMLTDHCTWDEEYKSITKSVIDDLTHIAASEPSGYSTVLFQGSGTYAVESMLNGLSDGSEKLLLLVNGEYGRRLAEIVHRSGKNYDCIETDMCLPLSGRLLEEKLKSDDSIDTVIFVHCETTTGILNPLRELTEISKKYGKKVFVDAMSSFGAYDIDMFSLNIDALAASANKCLEGCPGLSFVIADKQLLAGCGGRSKSLALDIFDQFTSFEQGNGKFRYTSPTHILLALRQAIDEYQKEGGLQARSARYRQNHDILISGMKSLGIMPILPEEFQSYIITTFSLGEISFPEFYDMLKLGGFVIYPGKLTDMPTFRIGNIGNVFPTDMYKLVDLVKAFLSRK